VTPISQIKNDNDDFNTRHRHKRQHRDDGFHTDDSDACTLNESFNRNSQSLNYILLSFIEISNRTTITVKIAQTIIN
jgi:hypothetical protein